VTLVIASRLEGGRIPVELILLEGEGHGAARRAGKAVFTGHTLRFLSEHS